MAAAVLNHHMTTAQALSARSTALNASATTARADATSNAASSKSDANSNAATVSANDFLTLLVTEMQNQDPTANTDPNEYINQLVNVNSLEQLVSINQTLTTGLDSPSANAASGTASVQANGAGTGLQSASSGTATALPGALNTATQQLTPGNLSIPAPNAAAQNVSQALSGH